MIFLILALFWLSETGQIWGFSAISQGTHGGNGLAFCMLMYLKHLQNWVDYGHSLLIFSNFGTILTAWNGSNWGILVMLCGYSSLWCPFDCNWSFWGFLGIIWRTCGSKCRGGSGGIFLTLCVEFCLVIFSMTYCLSLISVGLTDCMYVSSGFRLSPLAIPNKISGNQMSMLCSSLVGSCWGYLAHWANVDS